MASAGPPAEPGVGSGRWPDDEAVGPAGSDGGLGPAGWPDSTRVGPDDGVASWQHAATHGAAAGGWPSMPGVRSAAASRWRRAVERWSPVGLRGARTDPGRRGAFALVAVALIAAALVGLLAWHGRPRPEPIGPPLVEAGPGATVSTGPSRSAASLVVAVAGKVRRPGVVTVPAGSRVIDAVRAAGGSLPGADLATLNLARKLADGELVAVGVPAAAAPAASGGGGPAAGGSTVLDLNVATLADLDTLPGVGPVLAQRILDWRTEHGRFESVDQLGDVSGIGESRLAQLRDLVRV